MIRQLLYLYSCQESDEVRSEHTKHANGKGFTAFDAKILTSIAKYYMRTRKLSDKQMMVVEKRLHKYHRQTPPEDFTIEGYLDDTEKECLIDDEE